jgi:hypothetical protein
MESTNNQTNPSVSSTTLVTPNARGSDSKSGASSGKAIQPRMPIGRAASAQMPTILAREYCSVGLSLDVLCAMDSPSTPPGAVCTCALRNYPNLTVLLSPRWAIPFHPSMMPSSEALCELRRTPFGRSSQNSPSTRLGECNYLVFVYVHSFSAEQAPSFGKGPAQNTSAECILQGCEMLPYP